MSKQSEAKKLQGYTPKAVLPVCANCASFKFDLTAELVGVFGDKYQREVNLRCAAGEFAVKKMGTCANFSLK